MKPKKLETKGEVNAYARGYRRGRMTASQSHSIAIQAWIKRYADLYARLQELKAVAGR